MAERTNKLMVGRELRMIELKEEIEKLHESMKVKKHGHLNGVYF